MRKGWWKQGIFYGEEKMRIALGTLGAVSFLEDCDMEEGIELVLWIRGWKLEPLGRSHRKPCFHSM